MSDFPPFLSNPEFWKYTSIPLVSALVGWLTNVIALKMTFFPLEFVGVGKIGWQGIIPSRAGFMAGKAVDLLTTKLITIEDRFAQLSPERVAEELEPAFNRIALQIVDEVMEEEAPEIWASIPQTVKESVYLRTSEEIPKAVELLMWDLRERITEVFDLRKMVVDTLEQDRELLNEIFLNVGREEFKFIARSGLYFGFLFGLFQMGAFLFFNLWIGLDMSLTVWILPVAGLLVGWATNFLALRMIFEPVNPRKLLSISIQGLFLKRQQAVAKEYARLVAERILTARQILEELISGSASDRMMAIVTRQVKKTVDASAGIIKPLFQMARGTEAYISVKNRITDRFKEELPLSIRYLFPYAGEALDIEASLRSRMQALTSEEFVGFLRPVFQEDEWKLILVGAMLGLGAGLMQMIFVFSPA